MSTQRVRAAVYLRVSLDATGEQLAVGRQREDCLQIAADRGWLVTKEYADNSISASDRHKRRPAYEALVADFQAGAFDAIVCWDLDRLTRQPRQLEDWIEAAEERGLLLVTANGEADLTTDGGRMFARIKATMARAEVERKGARQRRALRQRAEHGRPPLGVRLTGYTSSGDVIPHEADLVREVFARFGEGESLKGLVRILTAAGFTTRHGKAWSPSTVRSMLTNARYCGHSVYRGERMTTDGTWKPLVNPEAYSVVQHRLTDPRRISNRQGTDRKHLGSGLYRCNCGLPMQGWSGNRYRCSSGCYSRSGTAVDPFVENVTASRLARPDLIGLLARPADTERATDLLAEGRRLRSRLTQHESDYDAGLIDGRRYAVAVEKVSAELRAVEVERATLLAGSGPAAILTADCPADAFRASSLMARRAVVSFLLDVTLLPAPRGPRTFDPETVHIVWKGL